MYNLLRVLLGISVVKHSVTLGNINKPLKALVQLDSLTCCPEAEASLTEAAFYGLSAGGETVAFLLTFVLPVLLTVSRERWKSRAPYSGAPEGRSCPGEGEPGRCYTTDVPIFDLKNVC